MRALLLALAVACACAWAPLAAPAAAAPRVAVNATSVTRGGAAPPLGFSWGGVGGAAAGGPGLYLCTQDSGCLQDTSTSAWAGLFPAGASFEQIGIQPAWSEANPPWLSTSPVKWVPLRAQEGAARFAVEGWPLEGAVVALFDNGTQYPRLLAASRAVHLAEAEAPRHVRLAPGDGGAVRVLWNAREACDTAQVEWGAEGGAYSHTAPIDEPPATYDSTQLCGPPANTTHGFNVAPYYTYVATIMDGLEPGKRYAYRVGGCDGLWSREFSFAAPVPPSATFSLFAAVVADMGETYSDPEAQYHWMEPEAFSSLDGAAAATAPGAAKRGARRTHAAEALSMHFSESGRHAELTLHVGDLSYATGYASEWDRWLEMIEPLAASAPYAVVEGNHERDFFGARNASVWLGGDSGGECGVPTETRFPMRVGDGGSVERWYSFAQGPVLFAMINTELPLDEASPQYAWLGDVLRAVDRSITPWVVVAGHRPMYSSTSINRPGQYRDEVVGAIEPLLYDNKVDLALWGHVHNAFASCPVYNSTCMPGRCTPQGCYAAPVHAIIGNAGQSLTPLGPTLPPFVEWAESYFGYSTLYADASNLVLSMYGDAERKLHYNVTLTKGEAAAAATSRLGRVMTPRAAAMAAAQ